MSLSNDAALRSSLVAALQSLTPRAAAPTNPFAYTLPQAPVVGRQRTVHIPPNDAFLYDYTSIFTLPRYGPLTALTLHVQLQVTESGTAAFGGVLGLFSMFHLSRGPRAFSLQYPTTILDWVMSQPEETRTVWRNASHLYTGGSSHRRLDAGTYTFAVPLPWACTRSLKHSMNTKFCEPLLLHCSTKPSSASWFSGEVQLQGLSVACEYMELSPDVEMRWLRMPRNMDGEGIARLQWSVYRETAVSVVSGSAATNVEITCPWTCFRSVVVIRSGGTTLEPRALGSTSAVRVMSGDHALVDKSAAVLQEEAVAAPFTYDVAHEQYVLQYAHEWDGVSPVMAWAHIPAPRIEVVHAEGGAVTGQVVEVYHYYHFMEKTDVWSGTVRVRAFV